MANGNLKFVETLTIEEFKSKTGCSRLDVKQNPKTSKLFFTYNGKVGAVSSKGIPTNPMVSMVETEDHDQFYLLHDEGQGAPTIQSF